MISLLLIDHALETPRSVRSLLSGSFNDLQLTCVKSYREILDAFRSNTFDVCLIDSVMDNGLKLFAQARSLGCTAPVVLVTTNDAREAIRAIRSGVADCLIRDDLSAAGIEHSACCVVEQARNASLQSEREHRYLALLDHSNEIVYTHDLEGNFTSMNRIGEQLLGYSQSEILGMKVWQLIAPEYRVLVEKLIARTLDAQTQMGDQVKLMTGYGRNLTVEINTHPINHDGKTIEIQCIATAPAGLPKDLSWESQHHIENSQPDVVGQEGQVLHLRFSEAANSFQSHKHSLPAGRSLFTF